jgi:hypothetical protein
MEDHDDDWDNDPDRGGGGHGTARGNDPLEKLEK